ncbi:hypothetical protein FISHEDRAFT_15425, partial [Fistulina hepatica ATCC 64428]
TLTLSESNMLSAATTLSRQWRSPTDVLSIVLLIGGDIIQRAIAQLAGPHMVPVAFSFGWVAYAFSALMSAVGDGRLMPPSDCPSIVVNAHSGYARDNGSWILGRILRDLEDIHVSHRRGAPMWVRVYEARPQVHRSCIRDWMWISGVVAIIIQLVVATIPWALHGDWIMFLVTSAGTILALLSGALPQWRVEKWACRKDSNRTVSLLKGNGCRLVVVIIGGGVGLNLEDLAAARAIYVRGTREMLCLLCIMWLALLITVAGLPVDTWYFMAIGLIGMVQNVVAAGARRSPEQFHIPLQFIEELSNPKVMKTLQDLECRYPDVGFSLLPILFPGRFRDDEEEWW